jgi:hypothetical protein
MTNTTSAPAPSTLRFARYSTYASYLSGNRAAYTTKTHIIGKRSDFPNAGGHYISMTLCGKRYSDMETHDGNGKVETLAEQTITCQICLREIGKIRKAAVAVDTLLAGERAQEHR